VLDVVGASNRLREVFGFSGWDSFRSALF